MAFLSACSAADKEQGVDYSKLEFVKLEQNRMVFSDLSEIEEFSEMIIVGEIIDDPVTETQTEYSEIFNKEIFDGVISYSTIRVIKVLSGNAEVGDEIKVAQYCGVFEDQFITYSEMTPMLKGDTWIFCLMKSLYTDGLYGCTGDSDGRYPLKNETYRKTGFPAENDLGVYRRDSFKDNIYNEIFEKYDP